MATTELRTRQQNFFQVDPPIFDCEFRRDGTDILLAFSAKARIPTDLRVRLYEAPSGDTRAARRAAIATDQRKRGMGTGFAKSNRFVAFDSSATLDAIAQAHGFETTAPILEHFANRGLPSGGLTDGDVIFVPQVRTLSVVPLGPLMPVEDVAESVPEGGHRHQARWSVTDRFYDPLDPLEWVPDSLMTLGPANRVDASVGTFDRRLWLPQFAILTSTGAFLDASLTPPEIVEQTRYSLSTDDPHTFAVLVGRGSRLLSADDSSATFTRLEHPVGAYGAVIDSEA